MEISSCPQCESELRWQDSHYHCDFCQQVFKKQVSCPDCHHALEKLQACGASNYFCPRCNELKSKKRIEVKFEADEAI
ncbi:zinc ribbon domain-containing protein [Parasalinivibrio latis]